MSDNDNSKLPEKFEDWKAPWADDPDSFDADRAARRIFGLLQDKQKANADKTAALAKVKEVEGERDALQAKITEASRKDESETDRLKRENEELKAKAEKAGETSVETLKLRVALQKNLTVDQAERLIGSTEEELLTDADKLIASFGGTGKGGDGGETDDNGNPRRTPRQRRNPADPAGGGDPEDTRDTFEILEAEIPRDTF